MIRHVVIGGQRRAGAGRAVAAGLLLVVTAAACTTAAEPAAPDDADAASSASSSPTTAASTSTTAAAPATTTSTTVVDESTILLAWTSGGLPPGFADTAINRPEVARATVVRGGQSDLLASTRADGTAVDAPPPGWAIPLDTVAIAPDSFASFVNDPEDRAALAALRPGEGLLTAASAELRGLDVGSTLELRGASIVVVGVIGDRHGSEAELVVHADDAARLGVDTERFVLMVHDPSQRAALDAALSELTGTNPLYLRTTADTTRLRHGDSVVPIVQVKATFGEFAYRDLTGRQVEIDPAWVEENIVVAPVPILGSVRCHRMMVEPLARALGRLEAEGLGHTVDPATFSGCWNARRMLPGAPLSKHAWGLAVDVNVDGDPRGSYETQHPRFVEIMREEGFAWGGDWLYPDPAHYELDP